MSVPPAERKMVIEQKRVKTMTTPESPKSDTPELLPCPFCGNAPTDFYMNQGFKWGGVRCCIDGPEVRTGYDETEDVAWHKEAIEEWNRRHDSPELVRLREELRSLKDSIAMAYGFLWHVNNEPGTPQQYDPERAAYEARKILRDKLTNEMREHGINDAKAWINKDILSAQPKTGDV